MSNSRKKGARPRPTIRPERELAARLGNDLIAGLDEAGRGPIAGPVVAAMVIWPPGARRPAGINDSKILGPKRRETLARAIKAQSLAWGVGVCHAEEIDLINILEATRVAAVRALEELEARLASSQGEPRKVAGLVTDALEIPALKLPTLPLIKGDQKSASVAAASILAKTSRDALMDVYAEEFPGYGWESNRGYPTEEHYAALLINGPTTLHRLSFSGVGFFCESPRYSQTFERIYGQMMNMNGHGEAMGTLGGAIENAAGRIPPSEVAKLREMLEQSQDPITQQPKRP